ncbi:MAG TPA: hypothetical protein GXX75_03500 [Clostridiales bacterium]|nr:hypothetical protein [Clostridiales bacterium]
MSEYVNMGNLTEMSMDEAIMVAGGGIVTLFLGCVGLAVSPTVACLCAPAGIALALTSGGAIINNLP